MLTGTPLPPPPPPTEVPPPSAYAYPRSSIPAYQTQQPKPYVALAPPEIKRREELRPDQLSGEINLVLKYFSSKDAKRIKIRKDMSVKDLMTEEKVCEHMGLVSQDFVDDYASVGITFWLSLLVCSLHVVSACFWLI